MGDLCTAASPSADGVHALRGTPTRRHCARSRRGAGTPWHRSRGTSAPRPRERGYSTIGGGTGSRRSRAENVRRRCSRGAGARGTSTPDRQRAHTRAESVSGPGSRRRSRSRADGLGRVERKSANDQHSKSNGENRAPVGPTRADSRLATVGNHLTGRGCGGSTSGALRR